MGLEAAMYTVEYSTSQLNEVPAGFRTKIEV